MCLDVFAGGRLLNVPFMMEQIWLHASGPNLCATEVYDFLIQSSDEQELREFWVASPHFCRSNNGGTWFDHVTIARVRRNEWGWFYSNDTRDPRTNRLKMDLPSAFDPLREIDSYEGADVNTEGAILTWDPTGSDEKLKEERTEILHAMKKSFYKITLANPLRPREQDSMWFRIIVEPSTMDIPQGRPMIRNQLLEFLAPLYTVTATITSAVHVRSILKGRFEETRRVGSLPIAGADNFADMESEFFRSGFLAEGTSTRIADHRIALVADSTLHLSVHGQPVPTMAYFGALVRTLDLPQIPALPAKAKSSTSAASMKVGATQPMTTYLWSGGSFRNEEGDLVCVMRTLLHELRQNPGIRKEDLAMRIAPRHYAAVCFLIDAMSRVQCRLIRVDPDSGCLWAQVLKEEVLATNLAEIRRFYSNDCNFSTFREAKHAFTDSHPFRIDFTATWVRRSIVRPPLIVLFGLLPIISLILGIINYFRN